MERSLSGQALIILGAPRSGTSAVANAFRLLGYYLGSDDEFPEPKEGNPMGIFERKELLAFNGKCSDELYLRHDRPDLSSMTEHPVFPRLVNEASSLLRSLFAGHSRWGWKEPQTTLLAPIYQAAFRRDSAVPGYLLCVRRPSEVFKSQGQIMEQAVSNREAPLGVRAYRRWLAYTLKSFAHSKGERRAMIAYNELVGDPEAVLDGAFRAVTGGDSPDPVALAEACGSVRPDLHRNRGEEDVPADAPAVVRDVWRLCCEAALDPEGLCGGAYDERIGELEAEYELLSTCFGEPEPPHCSVLFYVAGERTVFASPVLATGRWNSVEIDLPVGASTSLLGMLYPMPANVYVRNARWETEPARIRPTGQTVESLEGESIRYSVVSAPPQITAKTPSGVGPYRLRMEVFVEMNVFIAMDASARQSQTIRAMENHIATLSAHAGKMEEESMQLKQELARVRAKS